VLPTASSAPSSSKPAYASPLTGLDARTAAAAAVPVIAVPIVVGGGPPPQRTLAQADLVYQQFTTGAGSRLLAVFQGDPTGLVGPVAATEPMDGKLLPVLHGSLATSGGTEKFAKALAAAGVRGIDPVHEPHAFTRSGPGANNLYVDLRSARTYVPAGTLAPPGMWSFADTDQPLATRGDRPASRLTITMPGRATVVWVLRPSDQMWVASIGGTVVAVRSVIVEVTEYKTTLDHFPKGNTVYVSKIFGNGTAVVVSGGQAASGRYVHPDATLLGNVVDSAGYPMLLSPGRVWVVLAPIGARVTLS
jgi:hypothetical protein